jgi:hypothetical protein
LSSPANRFAALGFDSSDAFLQAARLLADVSGQNPLLARALAGRAPRAADIDRAQVSESFVEIPRSRQGDLSNGAQGALGVDIALAATEWALREPGFFFGVSDALGEVSVSRLSLARFRDLASSQPEPIVQPQPRRARAAFGR